MQDDIFSFEALSDQEIMQERGILPEGIYNFQVIKAEKRISSAGNPMLELKLKVWDANGKTYTVRDFLVATRKMAWKIKHFWESVGQPEKYNGQFTISDCLNVCGLFRCVVEKDSNGYDQAKVQDYVTNKPPVFSQERKADTKEPDFIDDDLDHLIPVGQ